MPDYRIEGEAVVLSSISHGGESAGTTSYLRREKIATPDGIVEVPVISGNAVRGLLRDISAEITWGLLGKPKLPLAVFDALYSGGSLAKAGSTKALSAEQLAELRRLCPHVALFGCAGGGRILDGRLRVGKMIPICRETAHLMPDGVEVPDVSHWDLVQLEAASRVDDAKRAAHQPALAGVSVAGELTAQTGTSTLLEDASTERESAQQMRYEVETICAGTRLWWWMALDAADDLVVAQMRATLNAWADSGAHVGGKSGTGHGRLKLNMAGWVVTSHTLTQGSELAESWQRALTQHHDANRERILEALSWLT